MAEIIHVPDLDARGYIPMAELLPSTQRQVYEAVDPYLQEAFADPTPRLLRFLVRLETEPAWPGILFSCYVHYIPGAGDQPAEPEISRDAPQATIRQRSVRFLQNFFEGLGTMYGRGSLLREEKTDED